MSRISCIADAEATEQVQRLFEGATAMLGRTANSFRTLAHSPHLASLLLPFLASLQREGAGSLLSTKIKEMTVIKTSQINGCKY